ncbi:MULTISPECIES: hypothetical protein [Rhodobacterales]|uniref:hypothetical protein n=1 Tax=Rhodobacterales TaxID=204455 RepID=UPI001108741E|nr:MULTISPECIES: hypothetical protein [Rhodobacterales]
MGLQFFFRTLIQWVIIAGIACLPLLFPRGWPVLPLFCIIVLVGLLSYGLLNPAFMVRRAFIWGSMTCISASLIPIGFAQLDAAWFTPLGIPAGVVSLANVLLSWLSEPVLIWPSIAVLIVLACYDLVLPVLELILPHVFRKQVTLATAEHSGRIVPMGQGVPVTAQLRLSVANRSGDTLHLTEASISFLGIASCRASSYVWLPEIEVWSQTSQDIPPQTTAQVEVVCQEIPHTMRWLFAFLRATRLGLLFDIGAKIKLYGCPEFDSLALRAAFLAR